MENFILQIEKKLWEYFSQEPAIITAKPYLQNYGDEATIETIKKNRIEITDTEHPVLKSVRDILSAQNLNYKPHVYEGVNEKSDSPMACFVSTEGLYLHYNPLILGPLDQDEMFTIVAHEIGHLIFPMQINPEEYFKIAYLSYLGNPTDLLRFTILAHMLTHINEYNADRYSLYVTSNLEKYESALQKIYDIVLIISPEFPNREKLESIVNMAWYEKFRLKHPMINDRLTALKLVENNITQSGFNINDDKEICQRFKELICYDQFIEMFGEDYEELINMSKHNKQ